MKVFFKLINFVIIGMAEVFELNVNIGRVTINTDIVNEYIPNCSRFKLLVKQIFNNNVINTENDFINKLEKYIFI